MKTTADSAPAANGHQISLGPRSPAAHPKAALPADAPIPPAADPTANALSVQEVLGQVHLIQQVMVAAMRDGEHYGLIPGCGDKPTLRKAGAEKLCLTFRLAPAYTFDEKQLEFGHREYRVLCTLNSIASGVFIGQGVGVCTSLEAKYRYRQGQGEPTDRPVPRAYWDLRQEDPAKAQELIGGKGYSTRKIEGKGWMICRGGEKTEHDNPADHYNTVLKMAKKRALVDAVLTATAASDIFTQDLEDISANLAANAPAAAVPFTPVMAGPAPVPAAPTTSRPRAPRTTARDVEEVSVEDSRPSARTETRDWRQTRVHFGRNSGRVLAELTDAELAWYVQTWLPRRQARDHASADDRRLMNGLCSYRHSQREPV